MRKSTRKKLGAGVALLATIVVTALVLADVPLITTTSTHFDATGGIMYHIHLHWPLLVPLVAFLTGIALLLFPGRDNAAE